LKVTQTAREAEALLETQEAVAMIKTPPKMTKTPAVAAAATAAQAAGAETTTPMGLMK
jgi:hypothetical protein